MSKNKTTFEILDSLRRQEQERPGLLANIFQPSSEKGERPDNFATDEEWQVFQEFSRVAGFNTTALNNEIQRTSELGPPELLGRFFL